MGDPITTLVRRVRRRIRVQRSLDAGAVSGLWALTLAAPLLAAYKVTRNGPVGLALVLLAAVPLLGAAVGAVRKLSFLHAAQRVDHAEKTHDVIASALSFRALASAEQTPFMRACEQQAECVVARLDPRSAARIRAPRELPYLLAMGFGLAVMVFMQLPEPHVVQPPPTPRAAALAADEELEAFRDELRTLDAAADESEAVREAARALNSLIEGLADRQLSRLEALQRLAELESRLRDAMAADPDRLREALEELAEGLGDARVTRSLAEALRNGDLLRSGESTEQIAADLESGRVGRRDRDGLQGALQRAAARPAGPDEGHLQAQREQVARLLKKPHDGESTPQDDRLLRKKRRELDKLERESRRAEQRRRELDQLRRELDDAAKQLAGGQGAGAADALRRAAQELRNKERQRDSQDKGQRLSRSMAQLREQISRGGRRPGASGQPSDGQRGQSLSLQQFSRDARSGKPAPTQGESRGAGASKPAAEPTGRMAAPGPEGSEAPQSEQLVGLSQRGLGAVGVVPGQQGAPGHEGTPEARQAAAHTDSRLRGEQRDGATRSEVIREASGSGFATRAYEKVHGDYRRHAESVLDRDQIPGGYRYYVRRYFQLIRPREEHDD